MAKREASIMLIEVFRLSGHVSAGPRGVCPQSVRRIRSPISPPPRRKSVGALPPGFRDNAISRGHSCLKRADRSSRRTRQPRQSFHAALETVLNEYKADGAHLNILLLETNDVTPHIICRCRSRGCYG